MTRSHKILEFVHALGHAQAAIITVITIMNLKACPAVAGSSLQALPQNPATAAGPPPPPPPGGGPPSLSLPSVSHAGEELDTVCSKALIKYLQARRVGHECAAWIVTASSSPAVSSSIASLASVCINMCIGWTHRHSDMCPRVAGKIWSGGMLRRDRSVCK